MIQLLIISIYLALLLGLGLFANRLFRGTREDYMLASHSIGPFLLLMSLFGTTMTAFALVGSTGESYKVGVGVYGMLASSSGIIHSLCFFLIGVKLWSFGCKYGYTTQIQFFRDRLESDKIGLLLFPVLVGLVIPYLLIGVLAAGTVINGVTRGTFPELFAQSAGGVPQWLASLVICGVVLTYVFFGGMRGTAWANAFQTIVFMILGLVTFYMIATKLGGKDSLLENMRAVSQAVDADHVTRSQIPRLKFFSYMLVPLSVAMFPHLFQHWLTAKSASSFKLPIVAHPIFIMIVWVPCVLVGVWATTSLAGVPESVRANAVLPFLVKKLTGPVLGGLLTAGILAAIMSSLDSQFLCIGTIFTEDVVRHYAGAQRFSERQTVLMARLFIVAIVALTYLFSLAEPRRVFTMGVWCFSGFSSLFPLIFAALYWRRLTKAGAYAGIIAAITSWFVLFYLSEFGKNPHFDVLGTMPVATMVFCSASAMVLVSLVTRAPSEATLAKFFAPKSE
jgi:SSS family solute:Na+ symporter